MASAALARKDVRVGTIQCEECKQETEVSAKGRHKRFCSDKCARKNLDARKKAERGPVQRGGNMRERATAELQKLLLEAGRSDKGVGPHKSHVERFTNVRGCAECRRASTRLPAQYEVRPG